MTHKKSTHIKDNYYYRSATKEDSTAIQLIVHETLREYGLVPDPEGIDADLNDVTTSYSKGYFGVISDDKNEIVGCYGLFPLNKDVCEIRKMYFLPKIRGKGLGKWAVRFLIDKARSLGYKKVALETASPLIEAIALYRKLGFSEILHDNRTPRCDKSFEMRL